MRKLDGKKQRNTQEAAQDWHKADIKAALEKSGTNLSALSKANGYSSGSARRALDIEWVAMERIIAAAIGVPAESIWPSRYNKPRNLNFTGGARKLTVINASSASHARNVKVRQEV